MSAHLIKDSFTDGMIAESPDSNTNPSQHSLGGNATGNRVQGDANAIGVAGLTFDDTAALVAFFFQDGHAQLAERGVSGGPGVVKVGSKRLAAFSLVVGISGGSSGRGAGRHPQTASLADRQSPQEQPNRQPGSQNPAHLIHPTSPAFHSNRGVYRPPFRGQGQSIGLDSLGE